MKIRTQTELKHAYENSGGIDSFKMQRTKFIGAFPYSVIITADYA